MLHFRTSPCIAVFVVWQVRYPYLDDLLASTARDIMSGDGSHPAPGFQRYLQSMAERGQGDPMHGGRSARESSILFLFR